MTDEKNFYTNNLAKAQKKGDAAEIAYWQDELDWFLDQKAKARAMGIKKPKVSQLNYEVQQGDSFFKVAERLYGDQRYAGALMDANPGVNMLKPGMKLRLPGEGAEMGLTAKNMERAREMQGLMKGSPQKPPFLKRRQCVPYVCRERLRTARPASFH